MKCIRCINEYLKKTRKLSDIGAVLTLIDGDAVCAEHYKAEREYKHAGEYFQLRRAANLQRQECGLYHPSQTSKERYGSFLMGVI